MVRFEFGQSFHETNEVVLALISFTRQNRRFKAKNATIKPDCKHNKQMHFKNTIEKQLTVYKPKSP